jgi:hypothetical protein
MEDQDIFNQIKAAANSDAMQHFGAMDKVWNRVEAKLDNKILKKENTVWKKVAVAASLLLLGTLSYQVFKNDKNTIKSNEIVTEKDSIQKTLPINKAVATIETANPAIKKEATTILQGQLSQPNKVALEENGLIQKDRYLPNESIAVQQESHFAAPIPAKSEEVTDKIKFESNKVQVKEVEVFLKKENQISNAHKEEPLLVADDKVSKTQSLKKIDADDVESLVVLKEPLYIINGKEYTEQEVFGPNPTSPYTPLNQQEIETISILQDEKAIELYGDKGKKGVVIITTKNGKPTAKKGK